MTKRPALVLGIYPNMTKTAKFKFGYSGMYPSMTITTKFGTRVVHPIVHPFKTQPLKYHVTTL